MGKRLVTSQSNSAQVCRVTVTLTLFTARIPLEYLSAITWCEDVRTFSHTS